MDYNINQDVNCVDFVNNANIMFEHITFEELWLAYIECCRHKRKTESCSAFEMAALANISQLLDDLNNGTYDIGYSICFVVTRPKLREVYAADFRDRIVHHLVIRRFNHLFEEHFIPSTYNCRKGKGVLYGVKELAEKIDIATNHGQNEAWIWKADLKNFFMSIEKERLYNMLETFLRKTYNRTDIDWWLWLIKMIVMHEPQNLRHIKGSKKLLNSLPYGKSLSNNKPGCGVAIGNLPSQIFANFLLSLLDYLLYYWTGNLYGRYVDDFYDINTDKEFLLSIMPMVRKYVKIYCGVELHINKWSLQQASKGVTFTGYVIKQGRIYTGNRTVDNAFMVAENGFDGNIMKYVSRLNSYLGFLSHTYSYAIRRRIWSNIPEETKSMIYTNSDFRKISVRIKYKEKHFDKPIAYKMAC